MLVLSRKVGESVCIDSSITVTVVDIRRGRVRLGIEAPDDISIKRGELSKWEALPICDFHSFESEDNAAFS